MNLSPAAQKVCSELTPTLQGYAQEFGLPADLAHSLQLTWDGESFSAVSDSPGLDAAEFGDGKGPAPRPVFKAMSRLEADAEELLTNMVFGQVAEIAQSARF